MGFHDNCRSIEVSLPKLSPPNPPAKNPSDTGISPPCTSGRRDAPCRHVRRHDSNIGQDLEYHWENQNGEKVNHLNLW